MNVIILCYDFPPLISIGGQRPFSWLKHLPEENIAVTIITRHWQSNINESIDYVKPTINTVTHESKLLNNTVIRVPFKPNLRDSLLLKFGIHRFILIRKFLSFFYSIFELLFLFFDARANIYYQANEEIQQLRPDYIIATGEPFILFKYAHLLSKKYNIPWVADYRDGWTSNQGGEALGLLNKFQNHFFQILEKQYLSNAALITTAAPAYADAIAKILLAKKIQVIYNGFDEECFVGLETIKVHQEKFVITYAGTIYPHQNLEMFLTGLQRFVSTQNITPNTLEVHFYGLSGQPQSIARLLKSEYDFSPYIKILPRIPQAEMAKKLRESHVLLLLSKAGANWLNAKVFDYFAVKRKILLVQNDNGILKKLLDETQSGFSANDANEVVDFLQAEYERFQRNESFDIELTNSYLYYTRKKQAQMLAALLCSKI